MIRIRQFTAVPAIAVAIAYLGGTAYAQDSAVQQFADPVRFGQRDGPGIYYALCQSCHMPEGRGAVGAGRYPPLATNKNLETAGYPVYVVLHGQKAMPPLGAYLDDEQVKEVVNYIRRNWGNTYADDVSAADVAAAR